MLGSLMRGSDGCALLTGVYAAAVQAAKIMNNYMPPRPQDTPTAARLPQHNIRRAFFRALNVSNGVALMKK